MERKSVLHKLADEKVNYYENNSLFTELIDNYYKTGTLDDKAWKIAFQCAANFLKKRRGKYWSYEEIENTAMDIITVLFTRIKDREYRILNLPKVIEQIYLTVYYSQKEKNNRKVLSLDTEMDKIMEKEYGE